MQNHSIKETYQLRLLHYETMMSRTKIFGAAIGAAVIYISSGRISSEVILASVVSLLCIAAISLMRSHIVYQSLADAIRTLIESGHIYVDESVKPQVNREILLPRNKEATLWFDITLYAAVTLATLILFELWAPIAINFELGKTLNVAAILYGVLFVVSLRLIPKYASFGVNNSSMLIKVWPAVPIVIGILSFLVLIWMDFPLFIGLCIVQLILICIALSVVWDSDRGADDCEESASSSSSSREG